VATETSGRPSTFVVVTFNVISFASSVIGIFAIRDQTKCLYIMVDESYNV